MVQVVVVVVSAPEHSLAAIAAEPFITSVVPVVAEVPVVVAAMEV